MNERWKANLVRFAELTLRYCAGYLVMSSIGEARSKRTPPQRPLEARVRVTAVDGTPEPEQPSSAALPDGPEVVEGVFEPERRSRGRRR